MAISPSALDPDAVARAKALLERPSRPQRLWPVIAAATLLALSALVFAAAMILAPPLLVEHSAREQAVE